MFGWKWNREDRRKKGEKSGEKIFLVAIWLEEGEVKNLMGLGVFFLGPPKYFLPKMKKKKKKKTPDEEKN